MGLDKRDIPGPAVIVTNYVEDLTLDCNAIQLSGSVCVVADVLGTVIKSLQEQGILEGTTAA